MMFDKQWFQTHQKLLLAFANTFLGRYTLRINGKRSSVGKNKIIRILPNSITWKGKKKNEYVIEFRTHNKFGKRLFYAFKPFWYLLHFWDFIWYPKFNLGFDTLTKYPDADPETNTVDGYVQRSWEDGVGNESWSTKRAGAGTNAITTATVGGVDADLVGGDSSGQWWRIIRGITLFDTSLMTTEAKILSAIWSLYGSSKANAIGNAPALHVVSSNPASNTNLVAGDYQNVGTTSFGSVSYSNFSTTGYNDISLDSNGIANISKAGISKFGCRTSNDLSDTNPYWGYRLTDGLYGYGADQTGVSQDPKLVVTYLLGGAAIFQALT